MTEKFVEVNFDGLVGPTHNFGGLSFGNKASSEHANQVSYPKKAALQGLEKMKSLHRLGIPQGFLPPHPRPYFKGLANIGWTGSEEQIIQKIAQKNPGLFYNYCSASPMWVANAGTVSPSPDTMDGKVHFTPANLSAMYHRSIEHEFTGHLLQSIFHNETMFVHHKALPSHPMMSDEGAANHTRFCNHFSEQGLELFVYGKKYQGLKQNDLLIEPQKFPARQTFEASEAIGRLHKLNKHSFFALQQNPYAIDQGVFHNDVIAVGHRNLFLTHELAFVHQKESLQSLQAAYIELTGSPLDIIEVPENKVTIQTAVSTYLFNSQLVNHPDGGFCLIAPLECKDNPETASYLEGLVTTQKANQQKANHEKGIREVLFLNLKESMSNGGGPACLRLRVCLSESQLESLPENMMLDEPKFTALEQWIESFYPERLHPGDLLNPETFKQAHQAYTALEEITCIKNLYKPFL